MFARQKEPIVAIATASGRGAVGIVRISGADLKAFVQALCGRVLAPRYATYLPILDSAAQPIDRGLAMYFPAPHSYTGEDVLELQVHGGPLVLQLVMARCLEVSTAQGDPTSQPCLPGLRLAHPGEFTERAFLNDKMDLTQAEAVADLIDASTEAAVRSASRSLAGAFSEQIDKLRQSLIKLRMLVEATLDFPEEEVDFLSKADARGQLERLQQQLQLVLQNARQGRLLREGIKVVIAGQPNAGKSSLLNALAGAELAIVTPIPGTTRDKVQETIQIEGIPLHIIDTAGLREAEDEVERLGIARAWEEIAAADAVLFLHDLTRQDSATYQAGDADILKTLRQRLPVNVQVLDIWNKADAVTDTATNLPGLCLSAKTGDGLDQLRHRLLHTVGWDAVPEGVFIARERHIQALRRVQSHLESADQHLGARDQALDLLAEDLRMGQNDLNQITGAFTSDDLLGVIFSSFCIGK
jgi:tRNA modification GTPase